MSSFIYKDTIEYIGTYEVSESDPSQIKLTINRDHTFYYQDFSINDKKIVVKGTWTLQGKRIILHGSNSEKKYHNVWTISEDGKVAKSRKGLTFYKICKISI